MKRISEWEVLTPSGWSDFYGIKCTLDDDIYTIGFSDGSVLSGNGVHKIKLTDGQFKSFDELVIDVDVEIGGNTITLIKTSNEVTKLYDLVHVKENNQYLTNNIVSHNCGAGNTFHKLWQQAIEGTATGGLGRFNPISLPWSLHPERDQAWRDLQDEQLGKLKAAQECDVEFLTSGHTYIDSEIIQYYNDNSVKDPVERRGIGGNLWIWKYPLYNKSYLVSADVARGDGEDFSAFHVFELETMEQVAEFREKVDTNVFGNILISIATEYNNARLVLDNKNIGWSTIQVIVDSGYKNLFYGYKNDPYFDTDIHIRKNYDLKNKEDTVPGITITPQNRPVMLDMFGTYMRQKLPRVYSKRLMNEVTVFKWINGKPQAARGYNDDLIMSFAIALFVRETALRMYQVGLELTQKSVQNIHRSVYSPKMTSSPQWEMPVRAQTESIKWLL